MCRNGKDVAMELERITIDPKIMQGMPCIRGMRITVGLVLNLLANGMSEAEILREYPSLEPEDIRQCLHYAAILAQGSVVPFTGETLAVSR